VVVKGSIFWDIAPCNPLKVNRRFGGICRLSLHGRRIRKARNQRLLHAGILLRLLFSPEDGGDMLPPNVGFLSLEYMHCILSDRIIHNHLCENLKSYVVNFHSGNFNHPICFLRC
jgi:hypothetical protein